MKKIVCMFLCLFLLFALAACFSLQEEPKQSTQADTAAPSASASPITSPSAQQVQETASPTPSGSSTGEKAKASPEESSSGEPAEMFASYAHMVSFSPETGMAEFDYFELLRGEDAVQWLVENDGYTQADAQSEVDQYADSEFIEKNTNPQLRSVNLKTVPLRLMFQPDGTMLENMEPADASFEGLCALYNTDPSLVLDSFFYYIDCENGAVISVEQVYWP